MREKEWLIDMIKETNCDSSCNGFKEKEFCGSCSMYEHFEKTAADLIERGVIVPPV